VVHGIEQRAKFGEQVLVDALENAATMKRLRQKIALLVKNDAAENGVRTSLDCRQIVCEDCHAEGAKHEWSPILVSLSAQGVEAGRQTLRFVFDRDRYDTMAHSPPQPFANQVDNVRDSEMVWAALGRNQRAGRTGPLFVKRGSIQRFLLAAAAVLFAALFSAALASPTLF
jgi:hypothetical protein